MSNLVYFILTISSIGVAAWFYLDARDWRARAFIERDARREIQEMAGLEIERFPDWDFEALKNSMPPSTLSETAKGGNA